MVKKCQRIREKIIAKLAGRFGAKIDINSRRAPIQSGSSYESSGLRRRNLELHQVWGESSGVGASNIRQEAEIQTTNGESPKFTVQAWVSPKYHREIRLCPAETVATLAREIEKEFEREYGLDFQVLTLQDPNHNDIPMSPKCKASLVLRNSDRVFVVIRPESLTCNNGRKRGASWQSRDDAKHRKRRSVDACFRSYFALHAEVTKLEDAVRSVASGKSCTRRCSFEGLRERG